MNQEPQAPLWPEKEIKTIGLRSGDASGTAQPVKVAPESVAGEVERSSAASLRLNIPGTFGEKLQRERELRSITLEEIAASTKIGTRLLHALETEEFEKLPGGIFNKGFVRAYARYLGLDEEQAVTDYLAAEAEKERKRRAPVDQEPSKQGPPQLFAIQGGSRPDNVYNIRGAADVAQAQTDHAAGFLKAAVILVFVLGVGGLGWKYYQPRVATRTDAPSAVVQPAQTQAPVEQAQVQQSTAKLSDPSSVTAASTSASDAGLASQPASQNDPKVADAASSKTGNAASVAPAGETTPAVPAEFTLGLRAEEDSWAQITADGKTLWSGIVSKDATKSFHASKELVVKLGNAPGIQLSYNGKPLPRFSQEPAGSKTRTLTFTSEGLSPR